MVEDIPGTPLTTISAIVGPCPALQQESESRAAVVRLCQAAEAKIRERQQQQANTKQKFTMPKSMTSGFRKALKNFSPGKKGKKSASEDIKSISINNTPEEETGGLRSQHLGRRGVRRTQSLDTNGEVKSTQALELEATDPVTAAPRYGESKAVMVRYKMPLLRPEDYLSARSIKPLPSLPSEGYSIFLGGQIPYQDTNRVPSTFLTPTNNNSYAIAGRSRLVSGRPIVSQRAEIYSTIPNPAAETMQILTGKSDPAIDSESKPTVEVKKDYGVLPGVPYSLKYLDSQLDRPGHRGSVMERAAHNNKVLRRSISVPADMMTRDSAIPLPLNITHHKTGTEHEDRQHDEISVDQTTVNDNNNSQPAAPLLPPPQTTNKIGDEYIVAAFDGVHKHINDVRNELADKIDKVNNDVLHMYGLLAHRFNAGVATAATAAAAQAKPSVPPPHHHHHHHQQQHHQHHHSADQQYKKRQHQHQHRPQEIRPNLTGMPPHIPFGGAGGMEAWYRVARK